MRFFTLFFVFFSVAAIAGCASKGDVRETPRKPDISIRTIAVIPFQKVLPEDQNSHTVRGPVSRTLARSCFVPDDAPDAVEHLFVDRLKAYPKLIVIPGDKTEGIYRRVSAESFKTKPVDVLRKVGKELEADAVAAGYLYCYRERKGYKYGTDKPASVVFEMVLVRVRDGAVIWSSYFDKTQRSLMENVLQLSTFIRSGGKWMTASELSAEGIDQMMETFPVSR